MREPIDAGRHLRMSAFGQKRTFPRVNTMSALLPKADIAERDWDVR
jgi:hypothetical protein